MPKFPINLEKIILYRIYDLRNNTTLKIHYTSNFNQTRKNFKLNSKKNNKPVYQYIRRNGIENFIIEELKKNPVKSLSQLEKDIYTTRGGIHTLF
jgi:hypothetical protein